MPFTSPEFPGLSFNSVQELRAAQKNRDKLRETLAGKATVTVSKEEEQAENTNSSKE